MHPWGSGRVEIPDAFPADRCGRGRFFLYFGQKIQHIPIGDHKIPDVIVGSHAAHHLITDEDGLNLASQKVDSNQLVSVSDTICPDAVAEHPLTQRPNHDREGLLLQINFAQKIPLPLGSGAGEIQHSDEMAKLSENLPGIKRKSH